MRKDWTECCFEDLLNYEQPTKYIVKSTNYNDSYKMPVLTAGKSFIKGYTNETDGIFDNLPTIIFDDFTTATQFVNFKFKVKSSAMKILVPTSKLVNMPLVYYAMQVNQVRSDTHKRYWISVFAKKKFLLPPLVEQKAIVKKIEELFSSLDSGIADLKKAQDQLVIYRQAVLKKAFEGEWKSTTVGELFDFVGGGTPSKREKEYWNGNIPWASVKDIKGDYLLKTQDFITEKGLNNSSANIALKGEIILITRISPGKSLITTIDTAVNQDLKVVKPKVEMYNKYAHYLFKSIERVCIKLSSGTTVKGINLPNLKSIEIPIIEPDEQHQIVQEIESRLSVCNKKVEKDIADSLEKAQALRQSILKKAFEGKLLSSAEIKECKEHKDYEPASVLLEKIKEEKSGITTTTKKSKPKKKKTVKKKPPVPVKISTDIQAGVIAKVIQLHTDNPKHLDNLTHVKCEKISHLVEYHLQIPLGRIPVKDAAGPDDYNHLKKVEHRANMAGYFKVVKKEIGHTYSASRNITKAIDSLESKITAEQKNQLDDLISLFLKFDLERAEIIATLYAGWNNLLIDGKTHQQMMKLCMNQEKTGLKEN